MSRKTIILGDLPERIDPAKLDPAEKLIMALTTVSTLIVGFRSIESSFRIKAAEYAQNLYFDENHPEFSEIREITERNVLIASKNLSISQELWSALGTTPRKDRGTPSDAIGRAVRNRNRFLLLLCARYFDAISRTLRKGRRENRLTRIFSDLPKEELISIRSILLRKIISLGGMNEISRCKSWDFIEYKSLSENWFMLFSVGCAGVSIMGKNNYTGVMSFLNGNKRKSVRNATLKTLLLFPKLSGHSSEFPIDAIKTKKDIKEYDYLMGQFIKTRGLASGKAIVYRKGERYIKGVTSRAFMISPILSAIVLIEKELWPGSAPYFCKNEDIRTTNFINLVYQNFEKICHLSSGLLASAPTKIGLEAINYDENLPYFFIRMPELA
ncbi:hypothetical protein [Elstera litoralis]|uniref:hypothetical protein n=1 Tax=Elstera litoralis TaxID=552518 RepID=UPI0012EE80D9|nr:hypothetical protein [Elstera litoralis]